MTFSQWLERFLQEKQIDLEEGFEVDGPSGTNHMHYQNVVDAMLMAPDHEKAQLKKMFIKLDYVNADIRRYLRHLAQAIAL